MNTDMLSPLLRNILLVACMVPLAGCGVDERGMVLVVDRSYVPAVTVTTHDGIAMPDGILWWHGKLIMADEGGSAIRAWDHAQGMTTLCDRSLGIVEPEDMVVDNAGNLFFTDDTAGGLWEIDRNGHASVVAGRSKGLFSTEGLALAPSGDILVGDGVRHEIFSVTREGTVSQFLDASRGITKPESMVYAERGNLYIADNHDDVLYRLTPAKKLERVLEKREAFSPETIWYANQTLFITDSKHGTLSRYTPEGGLEIIAAFGGKLHDVCGVTTDEQGQLHVSIQDNANDRGYVVRIGREATRDVIPLASQHR